MSPKAVGKALRGTWLKNRESEGVALRHLNSVVYQTRTGRRVGIACATERPKQPDKWFLGLPDQPYDMAVLLCQNDRGKVGDFVLPKDLVGRIWGQLSRSGGQVKLHIELAGSKYSLLLPGGISHSVDQLLGSYGPLK